MPDDVLALFHPATARWFRESFSEPTPPQLLGWPQIADGRSTLILAPTGSGKTLAAFLYALDELVRRPADADEGSRGVHTLYLSPLKALANDIERNLDPPLAGIRDCAERMGIGLPEIRVGRRTGDTPPAERQRMVRVPPDLLITTPESLHLLLTSTRAREMLRTVRYVIVDEIHALCSNKRGTFLSLLLERLEALVGEPLRRIGLSATQRPLDEIARFLGGQEPDGAPRPVAIVDAGMRKDLDLRVITSIDDMTQLPRDEDLTPSIWPSIYETLLQMVEERASTLIFANSRRVVERLAAEMNRRAGVPLVRAHHGSVSREERYRIEEDLKAGRLPALVATASMELGIDVGAIDLVCQVESPFSVASGLQRVGRAGHLVRATSVGRMLPKTRGDLLVMAAMSRSMLRGEISALRVPRNPLDVLAQQVVAMVAMDEWTVDEVYERVRCAGPYRDLPRETYLAVLELLSGRYRSPNVPALRPRVSWDRSTGRLFPLPGSRQAVLLNGGAIPDTGQYAMVLDDGLTRLGELDEEFVFERRLGDTFLLGTGCWRIVDVTHDRVIVSPAEDQEGMMPFWKGEGIGHDAEFGARFGAFLRECEDRRTEAGFPNWLASECALSQTASTNLVAYLDAQRRRGVVPTDRRILIDIFRNERGDERLAILSPYGRAAHLTLLLAVQARLRREERPVPDAIFSSAGILWRPGGVSVSELVDAIRELRADELIELVSSEVENTPYFAMRFRRNAGRALLLPRTRPGRRTPLWLQRLRAHDVLAAASTHPDFPIVTETYREILEDELPLEVVAGFLRSVEEGVAEFVVRRDRDPSPFAHALLLDFTGKFLYEEDRPVARSDRQAAVPESVAQLLGARVESEALFDAEAIQTIERRLQGLASFHRARDGVELVELLRRIGDLTEDEIRARCEEAAVLALQDLIADGRIAAIDLAGVSNPRRWVVSDDVEAYQRLSDDDLARIVRRFVASHAVVAREAIEARYPMLASHIDELAASAGWLEVERGDGAVAWSDPEVGAGIRRLTLVRRRRRTVAVSPETYMRFLLSHQRCDRSANEEELPDVLAQLAGAGLPVRVWDDVLSARIHGFDRRMLDRWIRGGEITWLGSRAGGQRCLSFQLDGPRAAGSVVPEGLAEPSEERSRRLIELLAQRGALFLQQIAAELDEAPSAVAATLWTLIWEGHVTNDSLDVVWGAPPRPERWGGRRAAPWGGGRWSRRQRMTTVGEDPAGAWLRTLLHRYGLVNRDLLKREGSPLRWAEAYPLLSRMEWRGDVERGLFVSELTAPQFATRGTLEQLARAPEDEGAVLLSVFDPACLFGDVLPVRLPGSERYTVRRHPSNYLVVRGGRAIISVERRGERLSPLVDLTSAERHDALVTLIQLVEGRTRPPSLRVKTWDGNPVGETPVADELEALGFERDDRTMIRYREYEGTRS